VIRIIKSIRNAFCKIIIWQRNQTLLDQRKNKNLQPGRKTDAASAEGPGLT
jgi:hypothetical protein